MKTQVRGADEKIVQLNYIKADVDSFEIGDKKQLELFLSNDDNTSSLRTDHQYHHDDYDDAEDDDYTDDAHEVYAVICIDQIKRLH